jgi:hypothetical protein
VRTGKEYSKSSTFTYLYLQSKFEQKGPGAEGGRWRWRDHSLKLAPDKSAKLHLKNNNSKKG